MAHGHGHAGEVHGADYREVPRVHPAGATESASHHGHTIVSSSTLLVVLLALVGLTLLTVVASFVERFVIETFHVQPEIATIINVSVALAIAAVKTTLVVMFFMQLKYDSPLNTMIFLFCLGTVALFLGFTMLDLGNRGTIDQFKGRYVQPGGLGFELNTVKDMAKEDPSRPLIDSTRPITDSARDAAIANLTYDKSQIHAHGPAPSRNSGPEQSRPKTGLSEDDESDQGHH